MTNSLLNLSYASISPQKERVYLLDYIEEQNGVSLELLRKDEVANSEILNEIEDISFEYSHESSYQDYFEGQLDSMQGELHFG